MAFIAGGVAAGVCDDNLDNDSDGATDYLADGSGDPGCSGATDNNERGTIACDDGKDNDCDGTTDYVVDGTAGAAPAPGTRARRGPLR